MNIGLIAMSGVRAWDQELLNLGLTMPGFVERGKAIASLPSLGLLTLAGCTPNEHNVTYIEARDVEDARVMAGSFNLVAISSLSAQISDAYEIADRFRAGGAKVVMGGLHVLACPEESLEHCDAVSLGEGEITWPVIVADAASDRLRKRYDATTTEFNLADSPIPRFSLLNPDQYNRLTVQTSRGCPHRCEFCASSILLTSRYKQKPVELVVQEIDEIRFIVFMALNSRTQPVVQTPVKEKEERPPSLLSAWFHSRPDPLIFFFSPFPL